MRQGRGRGPQAPGNVQNLLCSANGPLTESCEVWLAAHILPGKPRVLFGAPEAISGLFTFSHDINLLLVGTALIDCHPDFLPKVCTHAANFTGGFGGCRVGYQQQAAV